MKKHCKFTATFRYRAVAVAECLGLKFISSRRQVENGTLSFFDPLGGCTYHMYESGYIRRSRPGGMFGQEVIYQLNRVTVHRHQTETWSSTTKTRIMAGPDEQLGILSRSVITWRQGLS